MVGVRGKVTESPEWQKPRKSVKRGAGLSAGRSLRRLLILVLANPLKLGRE